MQWKVYGRRAVYESEWVNVWLDDVEIPGIGRIEHHVLTMPKHSTTAVVTDDSDRVLMLWRHRFITDTWGWEVPAGWADVGEAPEEAIRREIEEETGWQAATVEKMTTYNAISGISTMSFTSFHATAGTYTGPPSDVSEASKVEWIPLGKAAALAADGLIPDGPSLMALSYYLGVFRHQAR